MNDILDRVIIRIGIIASVPIYIVGGIACGLGIAWWAITDDWNRLPNCQRLTSE